MPVKLKGNAIAAALVLAMGCIAAAAGAASAAAQEAGADDLANKIVNVPPPSAHTVNGLKAKPGVRRDEAVQGGKALRINVPGKSENPWTVSLSNPIEKPIKAGDSLVLAFWARLEKGEGGAATASIPYAGIQLASAPYTALLTQGVTIGPEWKLHEVHGKADRDYKPGEVNVSLHLATGKQTIDIGPIFVLDLGPAAK
ncbi:MAG TPA: hypothetical protein VF727_06325 [Allosphingosinicella sp.]